MDYSSSTIAVIGLGYVGMPLAVALAEKRHIYMQEDRYEALHTNGVWAMDFVHD